MPRGDGTGPMGTGPAGWGRGGCRRSGAGFSGGGRGMRGGFGGYNTQGQVSQPADPIVPEGGPMNQKAARAADQDSRSLSPEALEAQAARLEEQAASLRRLAEQNRKKDG